MEENTIREGGVIYIAHDDVEEDSTYHLPLEYAEPAVVSDAPVVTESSVEEAAKVVPTEQPARLIDNFSNSEKLSDQALFDELNNVSEEVIKCRDQVLSKIS
ncbi:hypothetical protein IKG13_00695 [Candidatus Saccharibacteria bacterium]|nr:hypothetical protein [Candidatus Saccharibacteria bacterium]MBR3378133.1 hypothetical protein [Candidatus Saccharibacteria bacterium]